MSYKGKGKSKGKRGFVYRLVVNTPKGAQVWHASYNMTCRQLTCAEQTVAQWPLLCNREPRDPSINRAVTNP